MKIEKNNIAPIAAPKTESLKSSGSQPAKISATTAHRDTASVSGQAILLSKSRSALENMPEVRTDRVEELREQVANGTYQVPVEKLAEKLAQRLNFDV